MKIQLKHRVTASIIFECEAYDIRTAVELAVSKKIDLGGADLRGTALRGADLRGAYLRGADLGGAYLRGTDLRGAYLGGADLGGADLCGADLGGADLGGAYLGDGITINKLPIQISGLYWYVTIWDNHMQIGCEFHSHDDWNQFDDDAWLHMGGKEALKLKREQFQALSALCKIHCPKNTVEEG